MYKRRKKPELFDIFNITFMILFCITIIFPFWDMIVRSLSAPEHSSSLGMMLIPQDITFSSYKFILSDDGILIAYVNTILRTVLGVALHVVLTVLAAYPLSKPELPYRKIITMFFLIPMFFQGGMIPSFIINRSLGLVDNFLVYILPNAVVVYNTILVRNFFMSIDKGIEESAFIDGANYPQILYKIIVPISKPIIATIALFQAVYHWNEWMTCLLYIRDEAKIVVQIILKRMMDLSDNQNAEIAEFLAINGADVITSVSVQMATTIVTVLPIVVVYPFIQKYFVQGIMVGSVKG